MSDPIVTPQMNILFFTPTLEIHNYLLPQPNRKWKMSIDSY